MTGFARAARKAVATRSVLRVRDGLADAHEVDDALAVEEPLEIRVAGDALVITMRTPGDDESLVLGLLYAEGLVTRANDVGSIAPCGKPGEEGWGNVVEVTAGAGTVIDVERLAGARRGTLTTSACGVCGRRSIDDLVARAGVVAHGPVVPASVVLRAPDVLRGAQLAFTRTGGLHAAAALDATGTLLGAAEDVGRHNAVDKVVGALLRAALVPPEVREPNAHAPAVLVVSGRSSFEIVQKAAVAKIPIVASVSAASTLARDLADATGITLCGFVRDGSMVVYTHGERLAHAHASPPGGA